MKVFIEKDNDIKALEEKVNKKLESLEAEGVTIKGITYSTDVLPKMRGDKVTSYENVFSVMIAYAPFMGV